jgi:class 3 adenylate cyclase
MALADELTLKVGEFSRQSWGEIPNGYVVPSSNALTFGNTGVRIDATVLYADICGSTTMVDTLSDTLAAEYYKAFLHCSAKIVKASGGTITAYDGDRLMTIFVGDTQAADAITAALKISGAVLDIINPQFLAVYGTLHRPLRHTVGIDCGKLLAAKTGVRVDSDLVWVGPAANYAAKLNSFDGLDGTYPIRATERAIVRAGGLAMFQRRVGDTSIWDGPYNDLACGPHFRTQTKMDV